MAAQYDLYHAVNGRLCVVIQNDLLTGIATSVIMPVLPRRQTPILYKSLNPEIIIGDEVYVLMPQLVATLTQTELGTRIGSLAVYRDEITRALDTLLSGI
ncbi:hypothetical protein GCM10011360_42400 [Primorskyibacter flagellatus]|uniref:Toxin CcdB n=1 Tax=Primorskyibacter flagellatus TaxID=1387277 RepID=A0A917EJG3_9RHOB|nr:CcdB family protein [Primorskyibacter flagellatus]GGE50901.1 hypothetical protein GCM10011360_42400 [Primorskyibacter flagellatus]